MGKKLIEKPFREIHVCDVCMSDFVATCANNWICPACRESMRSGADRAPIRAKFAIRERARARVAESDKVFADLLHRAEYFGVSYGVYMAHRAEYDERYIKEVVNNG